VRAAVCIALAACGTEPAFYSRGVPVYGHPSAPIAMFDTAIDESLFAAAITTGMQSSYLLDRIVGDGMSIRTRQKLPGGALGTYNFADIKLVDDPCLPALPHEFGHAIQWIVFGQDDPGHKDERFFGDKNSAEKLAGAALRSRCQIVLDEFP